MARHGTKWQQYTRATAGHRGHTHARGTGFEEAFPGRCVKARRFGFSSARRPSLTAEKRGKHATDRFLLLRQIQVHQPTLPTDQLGPVFLLPAN